MPIDDAMENIKKGPKVKPLVESVPVKKEPDKEIFTIFESYVRYQIDAIQTNYLNEFTCIHDFTCIYPFIPWMRITTGLDLTMKPLKRDEFINYIQSLDKQAYEIMTKTDIYNEIPEEINLVQNSDGVIPTYLDLNCSLPLDTLQLFFEETKKFKTIDTPEQCSLFLKQGAMLRRYEEINPHSDHYQAYRMPCYVYSIYKDQLRKFEIFSTIQSIRISNLKKIRKFVEETGETKIYDFINGISEFFKPLHPRKPRKNHEYLYNCIKSVHPELTYEQRGK